MAIHECDFAPFDAATERSFQRRNWKKIRRRGLLAGLLGIGIGFAAYTHKGLNTSFHSGKNYFQIRAEKPLWDVHFSNNWQTFEFGNGGSTSYYSMGIENGKLVLGEIELFGPRYFPWCPPFGFRTSRYEFP